MHITAHTGLVLKHVEKTKSGSWQYRRLVPKDVDGVIMKREFKRKLSDSEREAIVPRDYQ